MLAFRYLPLADAHALAATSPLMVIALGVLFLGEKAGLARWLAVAAGFAGVLLIIQPGLRALDWPVLLPLIGAGAVGDLPDPDPPRRAARFARHVADLGGAGAVDRHHLRRPDRLAMAHRHGLDPDGC